MAKMILARHGQSKWNLEGLWTGLTDIDLTDQGREEARSSGEFLAKFAIDTAFTSELCRAQNTLLGFLAVRKKLALPEPAVTIVPELNERDYGVFTGKSKVQVRGEVGDDVFQQIRRSWDYAIEGGESLKDIHARVMPYVNGTIVPELEAGNNVLVVSHNNTLRAVVKDIEGIPDEAASSIELATAEVRVYDYAGGDFTLFDRHAGGGVH